MINTTGNSGRNSHSRQEIIEDDKTREASLEDVARVLLALTGFGMLYVASIDENRAAQAYMYAIKGVSVAALSRVAGKLMRGEYERDNAAFIPSPPEFAILAREEQRRINEAAKPRIDATPRSQPFKDLRVTQRQRSEELAREGFVLFATDVTHEKFASMAKARKLPVGSRHLWAIDEVWAPRQAQMPAAAPSVTSQEEDAA